MDARALGKEVSRTNAARNQAEVVQHRRAQLAGKLMHDVHGFFHEPLRAGDVAVEAAGADRRLLFQDRQPDVDARQCLGDDIMEFAADALSFLLLRQDDLADSRRSCSCR